MKGSDSHLIWLGQSDNPKKSRRLKSASATVAGRGANHGLGEPPPELHGFSKKKKKKGLKDIKIYP